MLSVRQSAVDWRQVVLSSDWEGVITAIIIVTMISNKIDSVIFISVVPIVHHIVLWALAARHTFQRQPRTGRRTENKGQQLQ